MQFWQYFDIFNQKRWYITLPDNKYTFCICCKRWLTCTSIESASYWTVRHQICKNDSTSKTETCNYGMFLGRVVMQHAHYAQSWTRTSKHASRNTSRNEITHMRISDPQSPILIPNPQSQPAICNPDREFQSPIPNPESPLPNREIGLGGRFWGAAPMR